MKDKQLYKSACDKTTIGWYRNPDPSLDWGCFFAEKKNLKESNELITYFQGNAADFKWVEPEYVSFLQEPSLKYEDFSSYVDKINNGQESWEAVLYPEFIGMTIKEVNKKLGRKSTIHEKSFLLLETKQTVSTYPEELSSSTAYWTTPIVEIEASKLPKEWDWSNIEGVNYISPPRLQGDCGSCYAISTVEMLESRLRILTNREFNEKLSVQYLLSCSFYTEGCDGGFPTLVSKFIYEFGLVSAECVPYKAKTTECPSECPAQISVSDYYYIGGYYGASNEESMMKELRARGPIIGNLEPSQDFSYYNKGIYSNFAMRDETSSATMRESVIDWEKVDHSVLIVGWGEEGGEKYWKVLNSWGENWGESGYFRIKRGVDEASIESMAEAAIPYTLNRP